MRSCQDAGSGEPGACAQETAGKEHGFEPGGSKFGGHFRATDSSGNAEYGPHPNKWDAIEHNNWYSQSGIPRC
jgi:hypothetical protein